MAASTVRNITVTASTDATELLAYVTAISSSTTPTDVMNMVKRLPKNVNTGKIGSIAVGAAMNIRRVIEETRAKGGVSLPEEWTVNGEINFSILAMLGHMLMTLPVEAMTPKMQDAYAKYVKTIGGVANIKYYSETTIIEGKAKRQEIMLKWANVLRTFDATKYQLELSTAFPHMVNDRRSYLGRFVTSVAGVVVAPFTYTARIVTKVVVGTFRMFRKAIFYYTLIMAFVTISKGAFPRTLGTVLELGEETAAAQEFKGMIPLITESFGATNNAVFRAARSGVKSATSILKGSIAGIVAIPGGASAAYSRVVESSTPGGRPLSDLFSGPNLSSAFSSTMSYVLGLISGVISDGIFIATAKEGMGMKDINAAKAYANIASAFREDFYSIPLMKALKEMIPAIAQAEVPREAAAESTGEVEPAAAPVPGTPIEAEDTKTGEEAGLVDSSATAEEPVETASAEVVDDSIAAESVISAEGEAIEIAPAASTEGAAEEAAYTEDVE